MQRRRQFLRATTTVAAGVSLLPRLALRGADAPSAKINLAAIGAGGMAAADIQALSPYCNIVTLCDVDWARAGGSFKNHPTAKRYRDFRLMFDALNNQIDAVLVAVPDHFHAVAAMGAIKHGKHVYCEKPLAHSIHEVRALMQAAQDHKVVTQLGNQGHSFDSIRDFCEMIWDGAIGNVHTIHAGCSSKNSGMDQLPQLLQHHDVPPSLNWDVWLGPAEDRPYHPAYLPVSWRGWTSFGNGTIGDWACHVVDPVFWALDLGSPATIEATVKDYDPKTQGAVFPKGDIITFEFPAKGPRGPVTLKWFSGTEHIPRPTELEADEKDISIGAAVIGDKGTIIYGSHGASQPRLIPESRMLAYKKPPQKIPRVKGHHLNWIDSIRNHGKAGSDFSYGGPLTEVALLGVIALKYPGIKLQWDPAKLRFPNHPAANQHISPPYRKGWML